MKAKRRTGLRARTSLILVTCILPVLCLAYVLSSGEGAESLSDRLDVVMMVIAVLALVSPFFILLRTAGATAAEDEADLARRLGQAVARAEPLSRSDMGGDRVPVRVTFTFRASAHARSATRPLVPNGTLDGLVADYRAIRPRRLVITGQSGAGKSVLARAFVSEFNKDRADGERVPVLIPLGDWELQEPFRDWVVRHLVRDYGRSPGRACQLVDAGLVLPVLDGLDELDGPGVPLPESRAQKALDALADYQGGLEPTPIVLTCRTSLYDALEASGRPMLDAARVEINPVEADEAARFLALRAGAAYREDVWRPVLDELRAHPQGVLAQLLSTPWRLVLMATAYERNNDPGELLVSSTQEEATDTLLSHFIPSSVRAIAGGDPRYFPEDVHTWLHAIATRLEERGYGADTLVLPELARSPDARWARRLYGSIVLLFTLTSVLYLLLDGTGSLDDWGLSALFVGIGVLGMLHLRRDGIRIWRRHDLALPPWGSPLWAVGMKLVWRGPTRWAALVTGLWAVLIMWRALVSDGSGGLEDWTFPLAMLCAPAMYLGLFSTYLLDPAAVGPSGWSRGGAFLAWVNLWPGAVLLVFSLSAGLGLTANLLILAAFGALCCAVSGATVMYLCWLMINYRKVPFRLSRFLDWSHSAGLVRVTGGVYQFRHREFREWLLRHPVPPRSSSEATPPGHVPARTP
ncbi:NACHT domain-containing protein [Streptomyces cyaneofuscatus]|uniref:NACHT domain-containing protein n=1 Tax=Streptomyces cyaneofuscatus TaxID=66883 RepID=UPI0036DBA824